MILNVPIKTLMELIPDITLFKNLNRLEIYKKFDYKIISYYDFIKIYDPNDYINYNNYNDDNDV